MRCPFCQHDELKVTDSREAAEHNAIRRRRECQKCNKRFTTFETVELALQVHKRDGRYEDFQKHKLLNGIAAACNHTTVSHDKVVILTDKITGELMDSPQRAIDTKELGEIVMRHLQELDPVAYIRFACVYRRFKKIDQLRNLIEALPAKDGEEEPVLIDN
ncbi:MAG: transcriptional regulator NrdR [Parachlamydiales bacterium]|jgi:transcriptional repressor NrdR